MATVGKISVAFLADLEDLRKGASEAASLVEDLSSKSSSIDVKADDGDLKKTKKSAEEATAAVEDLTDSMEDMSDAVEDSGEKVEETAEKTQTAFEQLRDSIKRTSKEKFLENVSEGDAVARKSLGAVTSLSANARGGISTLSDAYKGLSSTLSKASSDAGAFATSLSKSLSDPIGSLGRLTIAAASSYKAILAGDAAFAAVGEAGASFSASLANAAITSLALARSEGRLAGAISALGGSMAGAGAYAATFHGSMMLVDKATAKLNPELREAVKLFAGMAAQFAANKAGAMATNAAVSLTSKALQSQLSPLAAVTAFSKTYSDGLRKIAESSTTAKDATRAYARVVDLASSAAASLYKNAQILAAAMLRYGTAVVDSVKSGFKLAASLIKQAADSERLQRAVKGLYNAASALVTPVVNLAGKFVGLNANTRAGQKVFEAALFTYRALGGAAIDTAKHVSLFGQAAAAAFRSLPAGEKVITSISRGFKVFGEGAATLAKNLPSLQTTMLGVGTAMRVFSQFTTIATVANGKFRESLHPVASEMKGLSDMAFRLGASTKEIQKLSAAAQAGGTSLGALAMGQQNLFASLSKVRIGQINTESVLEAKIAFDRLGLSMQSLRSMSPQETFQEVAKRIVEIKDPADRVSLAMDLFGRRGAMLINSFRDLEDVEQDMARLGIAVSDIDMDRFNELEKSFERLKMGTDGLAKSAAISFTSLATAFNSFGAEVAGGMNALLTPLRGQFADAYKPLQAVIEVFGRIINIMLRAAGVIATFVTGFSGIPIVGDLFIALRDLIFEVLEPIEKGIDYAQKFASAFYEAMAKPAQGASDLGERLAILGKSFAVLFGSMVAMSAASAIYSAAMTGASAASIATAAVTQKSALITAVSWLLPTKAAVVFSAVSNKVAALTGVGWLKMAAAATAGGIIMATSYVASGVAAMAGFAVPAIAAMVAYMTGVSAAAAATVASSAIMAASWVVATGGLILIVAAIAAVIMNFSKLYAYFSNFGENIGKLLTWDGFVEAASAAFNAIKNVFASIFNGIGSFWKGLVQKIKASMMGIKTPEAIDVRTASTADIFASRSARAQVQQQITGKAVDAGSYDKLNNAVTTARNNINELAFESAKYGSTAQKAALAAREEFTRLQQRLEQDPNFPIEEFEKQARRIQKSLRENIKLSDTVSDQDIMELDKKMQEAGKAATARFFEVARGQDLGSDLTKERFFPTSQAIKEQQAKFQDDFLKAQKEIRRKRAAGEFGTGQQAVEREQRAMQDAQAEFDRQSAKINVDISFAGDIRKRLEDAFLTPAAKFEKELKKIADNKSLNPGEKFLATIDQIKQEFDSVFGASAGKSLRDREQQLSTIESENKKIKGDRFSGGRGAVDDVRIEAARRRLDIERRSALGLDATPGQSLQAGVDKINDVFGIGENGKTVADLNPKELKEYEEAIKKNKEAVKASIGVEQTAAQKFAEARSKLQQAFEQNVISEQEKNKAIKEQKDALLSALGISKSPTQEFEDAVSKIRENASELTPEELSKGLKEAKDKLLSALGIDKSPAEAMQESMEKLNEAYKKGAISFDEFAKGSQKARDTLLQSLGIPLDPVKQLAERMNDLQQAFDADQITGEEFKRGQEEARRAMLPGSADESPVAIFKRQMEELDRARQSGLIDDTELADRRLAVQADLQESLRPALDKLAPDRRQVGAADARSKAGVDTFFRILQGRDNPSLKAQLEIARNTKVLAEAARDPEAAPIIAQLSAR